MTKRSILTRRRAQLVGALIVTALLPYLVRSALIDGSGGTPTSINALLGNMAAVVLALWIRHSVEPFPGVRASALNLPVATASHAIVLVTILMLRLEYDRLVLAVGYILHILWLYITYFMVQRRTRMLVAIVPFGRASDLIRIDKVDWLMMGKPDLNEVDGAQAMVADFGADLPPEWEAFLADAALDGRIVYQVKQLHESLTGRVELEHISENSFGSLVPARGYFHLKELADLLFAVALLPVYVVIVALVAIAIQIEGPGAVFFSQQRIGHAGKRFKVIKFRTMHPVTKSWLVDARTAAITSCDDNRITRVGAFLRRTRIDELPQLWNVIRGEMSWIGPRPEAEILSAWYTGEIPFYRYRHVVKPGISGWAQVNQGHVAQVDEVHRKLQFDFYYIKYFSPWLDVLIVFRTVKTIFNGFGAR